MHNVKTPIDDSFLKRLSEIQNHHESGDFEAAERGYRELINAQPALWQLYFNMGLLLFDLHRYEEALEYYRDGLTINRTDADFLYNYAICLKELGRLEEAIDSYREALAIAPGDIDCRYNLAGCLQASGEDGKALSTYLEVLDQNPEHLQSLNNAAYLFHKTNRKDQARDHYRRILQLDPKHASADHMLAALSGTERTAAPESYVRKVFDQFADHYEASLTGNLHYCLPVQLHDFYGSLSTKRSIGNLLDLGCGTGLIGEQFHSISGSMTGVDLSAKMVDAARHKNIYEALYVSEIVAFLEQNSRSHYDLVVSGDVFPYIGDLAPLLAAAFRRVCPRGYYLFSVEHEEAPRQRPQLQKSGRFSHSHDYIKATAKLTGWKHRDERIIDLRKEGDIWIKGAIYALVKD